MTNKSDLIAGLENLAKSACGRYSLAQLADFLPIEARERFIRQDISQFQQLISPHIPVAHEIEVVSLECQAL